MVADKSHQQVSAMRSTTSLEPATRFALADLITSVLRLDFWDDAEPSSIFFSKVAFEIAVTHLQLPEKVVRTLKTHLE
ncbi:hypothetical protein ANCCEY_13745, partial [Ancylostoma ceylanicum]